MVKNILLLLGFVLLFQEAIAQDNVWIKGKVTNATLQPIKGASVYIKGTLFGIRTNDKGEYELPIPRYYIPAVVVYRYKDFEEQELKVDGSEPVVKSNIQFVGSNVAIQEVVVSASKRREKIVDAPASVSVLTEDKIQKNPFLSPAETLKKIAGVDNIQVNLIVNNLSIRGFNQLFTQSALAIVDYRLISLPSLRFNAYQLIPNNMADIKRIELVRGPASALYGPNASYGVINMITKSPLEQDRLLQGNVSVSTGFRSKADNSNFPAGAQYQTGIADRAFVQFEPRFSFKLNENIGIKISGSILKAMDYEYYDTLEPKIGEKISFGSYKNGEEFQTNSEAPFSKDFNILRASGDMRFDFKLNKELYLIVNGGLSNSSNIGLSPLGTSQSENFKYYYLQTRINYKTFFFQTYMNYNDAGNSYIIPRDNSRQAQLLEDNSRLFVVQAQNNTRLNKFFFIYGLDGAFTRPQSFNTIFGKNENKTEINQYGGYGQAEYKPIKQLTLLAALRLDYQDNPGEWMVSPRAAAVYKPTNEHAFRFTYNRAFNSPSPLNLFIDLFDRQIGNQIKIKQIGNNEGFNYVYDANQNIMMKSPYNGGTYTFNEKGRNSAYLQNLSDLIQSQLLASPSIADPNKVFPAYMEALLKDIGNGGNITNVDQKAIDYITYSNNQFKNQAASEVNVADIKNLTTLKSTITQTLEFGYKFIQDNKFSLGADIYYSLRDNFYSTSTVASYSVIFDNEQFKKALMEYLPRNVDSLIKKGAPLLELFDQNTTMGGNSNGSAIDEIMNLFLEKNRRQTLGTIAPNYANSDASFTNTEKIKSADIILTPINVGRADIFGIDFYTSWFPSKSFELGGNFSLINKDRIQFAQAPSGYVALNAPRYKSQIYFEHTVMGSLNRPIGLSYKLAWRWQDAFPAFSSIWQGDVKAANFVDVNINYTPRTAPNTTLSLSISNLLDYLHQGFPGTAQVGRVLLFKINQNFSTKKKTDNKR